MDEENLNAFEGAPPPEVKQESAVHNPAAETDSKIAAALEIEKIKNSINDTLPDLSKSENRVSSPQENYEQQQHIESSENQESQEPQESSNIIKVPKDKRKPSKAERELIKAQELIELQQQQIEYLAMSNKDHEQLIQNSAEEIITDTISQLNDAYKRFAHEGDLDGMARANEEIINLKLQQKELQEARQRQVQEQQQAIAARSQYPVDMPPPHVQEAFSKFVSENRWANPRDPNYDPALNSYAEQLAQTLNNALRFEGRADEIGTEGYYSEISNYMKQALFGGALASQNQKQATTQRPATKANPYRASNAPRGNYSSSYKGGGVDSIRLTPAQEAFVNSWKTGEPHEVKVRKYKESLFKLQNKERNFRG